MEELEIIDVGICEDQIIKFMKEFAHIYGYKFVQLHPKNNCISIINNKYNISIITNNKLLGYAPRTQLFFQGIRVNCIGQIKKILYNNRYLLNIENRIL